MHAMPGLHAVLAEASQQRCPDAPQAMQTGAADVTSVPQRSPGSHDVPAQHACPAPPQCTAGSSQRPAMHARLSTHGDAASAGQHCSPDRPHGAGGGAQPPSPMEHPLLAPQLLQQLARIEPRLAITITPMRNP